MGMFHNKPRISVIIPTYNRAGNVTEAINSVLNQTYKELEIIVVDDGSTDNTKEIIASLFADKVRYIYTKNSGPARARNLGIRVSTGEYIAFLDSDDLWEPTKIEKQIDAFLKDERLGIVATNVIYRYPNGDRRIDCAGADTNAIRVKFLDNNVMVTSSVMIRKTCLDEVGGFDESIWYAEDWELFYRVARKYHAKILPDYLTIYKCGQKDRLMTDPAKRERLVGDTLKCLNKIFSYPENKNKNNKKSIKYYTFLRWIALSDLYENPRFARKYLHRVLRYKPWDAQLYIPLVKSYLIGSPIYNCLRALKRQLFSAR